MKCIYISISQSNEHKTLVLCHLMLIYNVIKWKFNPYDLFSHFPFFIIVSPFSILIVNVWDVFESSMFKWRLMKCFYTLDNFLRILLFFWILLWYRTCSFIPNLCLYYPIYFILQSTYTHTLPFNIFVDFIRDDLHGVVIALYS